MCLVLRMIIDIVFIVGRKSFSIFGNVQPQSVNKHIIILNIVFFPQQCLTPHWQACAQGTKQAYAQDNHNQVVH